MSKREVYLKPNVLAEPLFNQWYAWTYLLPPCNAARFTANAHIKMMQSFVANPQLHASALHNVALSSGPFILYDGGRVKDVKALMEKTRRELAPLLQLAEAIDELEKTLAAEADGHSLEPLYQKIPDALKGYVELFYDMNNNPSIRFLERLLYRSPYYNKAWQSVALSLVNSDDRNFVVNTPKFESETELHLRVPFDHAGLDALFAMKETPSDYASIKELLGVEERQERLFSTFFTEEPPPRPNRPTREGTSVRYFGHACVLIASEKATILVDPLVSYGYQTDDARYTYADLPERIDFVLLTHFHQDHLMLETLLQLRHKIGQIVVPRNGGMSMLDPSLKLMLEAAGFPNVVEIDELEELRYGGLRITGVPFLGEHADFGIRSKIAYLVETGGRRVMLMADSNNLEPDIYSHLRGVAGGVDALFLGMECDGAPLTWLYGPLLGRPMPRKMDQSRRLNGSDSRKALDIVERLDARRVYVYAMGQEPWLKFVMGLQYTSDSRPIVESDILVQECGRRGLEAERLFGHKEITL